MSTYSPEAISQANEIIGRGDQLVRSLPTGLARFLWRRVLLIQSRSGGQSVPGIGVYFACAGAQIDLVVSELPVWSDEQHGYVFDAMRAQLESSTPRLELTTLEAIGQSNFRQAFRFQMHDRSDENWVDTLAENPYDLILVDGTADLLADPVAFLSQLHQLSITGALIEIVSGPNEPGSDEVLSAIAAEAIRIGFGIRHRASSLSNEARSNAQPCLSLGLVRLETPMTDFPVIGRENTQIMSQCQSRLDIACRLVDGLEVLDAGGGTGIGAKRYVDSGAARVVSLDVNHEAIDIGRQSLTKKQRERIEFVPWDLNVTPLPFEDASFDLIVCLEVLEHIHAQSAAIREFERLLRPGGQLLISVPDREFEQTSAQLNRCENPFHLHVPNRDEFSRMLNGFENPRWLRQLDVVGTLMTEDTSSTATYSGRFSAPGGWNPKVHRPEVIAALCRKPDPSAEPTEGSDDSSPPQKNRRLISTLRPWGYASEITTQLRMRHIDLENRIIVDRYEWWRRCNDLTAKANAIEGRIQQAETLAEQARVQRDQLEQEVSEQHDLLGRKIETLECEQANLQTELDQVNTQREVIAKQLEQERASLREQDKDHNQTVRDITSRIEPLQEQLERSQAELAESRRGCEELKRNEFVARNEADQLKALLEDHKKETEQVLTEARDKLSEARDSIDQYKSRLHTIETALAEADGRNDLLEREREALLDERQRLLDRINGEMNSAINRVEQRCLNLDSRTYDLEEDMGKTVRTPPPFEPSGNGGGEA